MNDTLAEEILTETENTLKRTGLKFSEDKAEILTGSVEGACGWLTVNYLNNNLQSKVSSDRNYHTITIKPKSSIHYIHYMDNMVLRICI